MRCVLMDKAGSMMGVVHTNTHREPDIIKLGDRIFRTDSRLAHGFFVEASLVAEVDPKSVQPLTSPR